MNDECESDGPWQDPIVAEVRAVRAALFAASGSDIRTFCRALRVEQARSGHAIVTRAARSDEPRAEPSSSTSQRANRHTG